MKSRFPRVIGLATALIVLMNASSAMQPQTSGKTKPSCARSLADCANEGCGTNFDPKLNLVKNITTVPGDPTPRSITWMQKLDDPDNFAQGDDRTELQQLGEGGNIVVVAYMIAVRKELSGESCNCYLHTEKETDNHLVLVKKSIVDQMPLSGNTRAEITATEKQREAQSTTAEFTPRVRRDHPDFTYETMQPLIDATPQKALWVRVTGQLMFDSEHFLHNHLDRVNNWEIHPVVKMEYCTTGSNCAIGSDTGWKSIDEP
ncbi:MAG: hypothetical protein WAL34_11640 [Acidobacteriaceae bacterium]